MLDAILDWSIVFLPTVLSVVGVFVSIKAPHSKHHRAWRIALVLVGIVVSVATFWQQARSRNSHVAELHGLVERLNQIERNTKEPPRVQVNVPAPRIVADGTEWSRQIQDPTLLVEPEWEVKAKRPGIFELSVRNVGSSDVRDIEIYHDYFTLTRTKPITMERLGAYVVYPDVSLPKVLKSGRSEAFTVDFSKLMPVLEDRRQNWFKYGNAFMNVLRIKMNWVRLLWNDG